MLVVSGIPGAGKSTIAKRGAAARVFEPAQTRNTGNLVDAKLTAPTGARI